MNPLAFGTLLLGLACGSSRPLDQPAPPPEPPPELQKALQRVEGGQIEEIPGEADMLAGNPDAPAHHDASATDPTRAPDAPPGQAPAADPPAEASAEPAGDDAAPAEAVPPAVDPN